MPEMICPDCEEEATNHFWEYCPYCGAELVEKEEDGED